MLFQFSYQVISVFSEIQYEMFKNLFIPGCGSGGFLAINKTILGFI